MFAETEVARNILEKRYYSESETQPDQLLERVAKFVASEEIEKDHWQTRFYNMMKLGLFLPNSPTLVNAGRGGGLFACFVLGMEDSLEDITAAKTSAMAITKSGGGWGIPLSHLRPSGSVVKGSTHGIAGGPISFLETFSADMKTMTQGGFRDAACMATMDVRHPDIMQFIMAKTPVTALVRLLGLTKLYGAEARTVAEKLLKDDVMRSVAETYLSNFNMSVLIDDDFMKTYLDDLDDGIDTALILTHPRSGIRRETTHRAVMEAISESAWRNGEPGIIFIDTVRERTPYDPQLIHASNPCGEQNLPPDGSCCLGSINLSEHVLDGEFNYNAFSRTVVKAVRFLDNMISLNEFPTPETEAWSLHNRSIGLGVMGYADALIKMGLQYGSNDSLHFARRIGEKLQEQSSVASTDLREEKGGETWDGRRNNALLSIAPTGTISLLAGCSPGIEPIFSDQILRIDQTGQYYVNHPLANKDTFVTVAETSPADLIDTVSAFAFYIDNSISYTLNVSNDAEVEDVTELILQAWSTKCNGITLYRDGSRERQVLNRVENDPGDGEEGDDLKRADILTGHTHKHSGYIDGEKKNVYVTVNHFDGHPWEVFLHTPRIQTMSELQLSTLATRMTSLCLRYRVPIDEIVSQMKKVEGQSLASVPAVLASVLSEYGIARPSCPQCKGEIRSSGGCDFCEQCGYSSCS